MTVNYKRSAGFYISVLAAVIGAVGIVMYRGVTYKNSAVYVVTIAAVILEVLLIILSLLRGVRTEYNIVLIAETVLAITGAAISAGSMATEIAYVISGLNEAATIYSYIQYIVLAVVSWLLFLISSYTGIAKPADE